MRMIYKVLKTNHLTALVVLFEFSDVQGVVKLL